MFATYEPAGSRAGHFLWVGLIAFVSACGVLQAQTPLALHPDNPHYFLWQGAPTLLVTSGEHYGGVLNLDFDYVRYFDELQRNKLNLTRTFSGVYRETSAAFGITDNTLAPLPERFICPWARSQTPGYAEGGNKFDLCNGIKPISIGYETS